VQALAGPAGYAGWINANYPGLSNKNATADPDGDGVTNYDEFVFGLNPGSSSSVSPIVAMPNPATDSFRYNRLNPTVSGLTFKIMVSSNLSTWVEDTTAVQSVFATNGDVQTITVTLGAAWQNEKKLFMRVTAQ
jgi:hypothetical protein